MTSFFYDKFTLPRVRMYAHQFFYDSLSLTSLICSSTIKNFTNVQYTDGQRTTKLNLLWKVFFANRTDW